MCVYACVCGILLQVVAARGCAYVVMVHRSDATRARQGLKDIRIGGQHGKVGGWGWECRRDEVQFLYLSSSANILTVATGL